MFPREHVDDVHLPGISVIGSEDVAHGLPERFAEERIVHEDDARIIGHLPVHDAGSDTLDHSGTLLTPKPLNIALSRHSQLTIDLDAHDPLERRHPCDQ